MASDADVSPSGSTDPPFWFAPDIDPQIVDPENYAVYCQLADRLNGPPDDIPLDAYRCVFTLGSSRARVRVRNEENCLYLWFVEDGEVYKYQSRPENGMTPEYYLGLVRGLLMVCS